MGIKIYVFKEIDLMILKKFEFCLGNFLLFIKYDVIWGIFMNVFLVNFVIINLENLWKK